MLARKMKSLSRKWVREANRRGSEHRDSIGSTESASNFNTEALGSLVKGRGAEAGRIDGRYNNVDDCLDRRLSDQEKCNDRFRTWPIESSNGCH